MCNHSIHLSCRQGISGQRGISFYRFSQWPAIRQWAFFTVFQIITTIRLETPASVSFPAVTVCHQNRVHCKNLLDRIEVCRRHIDPAGSDIREGELPCTEETLSYHCMLSVVGLCKLVVDLALISETGVGLAGRKSIYVKICILKSISRFDSGSMPSNGKRNVDYSGPNVS